MPRNKTAMTQAGKIVFKVWSGMRSEDRQAYVIGWQNVMDDAGWHPAYDTLDRMMQRNYENGRLDATNVKAAGIPCPFWGAISKQPYEIVLAIHNSIVRTGDPRPPMRKE
jgi:hypothetical protein